VRITAENIPTPFDGSPSRYAFWFDLRTSDMAVNGVKISVEGYTSNPTDPRNNYPNNYAPEDPMLGQMSYYLSWPQLPSGILNVIFSDLYLNGDITSWTLDWQP